MGSIIQFSIKQQDGTYKNYTAMVNDSPNQYNKNVEITETQTKEQRENNEKKIYVGSGNVVWTNGKIFENKFKIEKNEKV
jgi:hypothetical protein